MANVCISLCVQVQGHVDDAVAKGATVTVGGSKPDLPEPYNKVVFSDAFTWRVEHRTLNKRAANCA